MDEQQIDRHYSADQLKDLYKHIIPPKDPERLAPPKDELLSEIIHNESSKVGITRLFNTTSRSKIGKKTLTFS